MLGRRADSEGLGRTLDLLSLFFLVVVAILMHSEVQLSHQVSLKTLGGGAVLLHVQNKHKKQQK